MKIGIIADAHGNEQGLSACLELFKKRRVQKVFFLGDAVGYFTDPGKVIDLLSGLSGCECLLGNHDAMLLKRLPVDVSKEKIYKIGINRKKISKRAYSYMATWKPFISRKIGGSRILLVHGSPFDPICGYVYPDSDIRRFDSLEFDFIFTGHTHIPFIKKVGHTTVVNVGSCGLSRDHGGLSSCCIFESRSKNIEIIRIPLNVAALLKKHGRALHRDVPACLNRKARSYSK